MADCVRCQCRLCGDPEEDSRCKVLVCEVVKARWLIEKGPHNWSEQALEEAPVLCGDCRDHALLMSRREAVKRMQRKRKLDDTAVQERTVF